MIHSIGLIVDSLLGVQNVRGLGCEFTLIGFHMHFLRHQSLRHHLELAARGLGSDYEIHDMTLMVLRLAYHGQT